MSRNNEPFIQQVMLMPWWVGALLSVGSYLFIRFMVPSFFAGGSPMLTGAVKKATPFIANLFAFVFAFAAVVSAIRTAREKWKNNHD